MRWIIISSLIVLTVGAVRKHPPNTEKAVKFFVHCCRAEKILPASIEQAAEKCKGDNKNPNPIGLPHQTEKAFYSCYAECVLKNLGCLAADGTVNKEATREAFLNGVEEEEHRQALTTALDTCFSSYMSNVNVNSQCHSGSQDLVGCVMREVILKCPNSLWMKSKKCRTKKIWYVKKEQD